MHDDDLNKVVDEIDDAIQRWLQSLPEGERLSPQTARAVKLTRAVALDGIARASEGKKRFIDLAHQARRELNGSPRR
jgi:hypothetical protein